MANILNTELLKPFASSLTDQRINNHKAVALPTVAEELVLAGSAGQVR